MYQNYNRGDYGGYGNPSGGHYAPNHHGMPSAQTHSPSHHTAASSSASSMSGLSSQGSSGQSSQINESAALALLQHLDKNELQHLMDNDSKLQDLIDDLAQVKGMQQEHDNLIATNKSLAEYNLSLQPRIEELKHHVASEYEKVNSLKTDLASHKATLDTYVGRQSLDTLHALLQTETAKSEEDSEALAERFCVKDVEIEEFLTEYLPKRTVAHLRRIKSERLAELIRDTGPATGATSYGRPGSMSGSGSNSNWGAPYPDSNSAAPPYPTSGFGMPQPNMFSSQ